MFYEMLTGSLPFMAESSYEIMNKHINTSPKPPKQYLPQLPTGVEQIILCAMEKDPTRRYQSASQMLRHIYRIQQNPATVFQKQTPSRTTTADVAIKMTTEKSENAEKTENSVQAQKNAGAGTGTQKAMNPTRPKPITRQTQSTDSNKPPVNTSKNKKTMSSESVPFSAVIMICTIFCILAIVGFFLLYNLLCKGNMEETSLLISSARDITHDIRNIGMEMRLR
jgi:serine/threonine protein kinase